MENYKAYTILFIGVNLFLILVTIVYFAFFKSDPMFNFSDTLGKLFK